MTHSPLELIHPRNLKYLTYHLQDLIRTKLWAQVIIGMLLGVLTGMVFGDSFGLVSADTGRIIGNWLAFPGELFLTMVQMIIIPLIFASIIRGIAASESLDQVKRIGMRLVVYFLITSTIAVSLGIGITSFIKPGDYVENAPKAGTVSTEEVQGELSGPGGFSFETLPRAIISTLPQNPLSEALNRDLLAVVLFSIIIGLALATISAEQSKPLLNLFGSIQSVTMTVVKWAMYLAPVAVFGLLAQLVIETGLGSLFGIGVYVVTVILGLIIMFLFYMVTVFLFAGITPWYFLTSVKNVLLIAFSTGSSVATMPLTLKAVEEKLRVRPSISQFVVPIGATVNMDATALFQGIATFFLVQVYDLHLSFGAIILLVLTVVGSSIGAPATPGAGIVILSVVLKGVGVPVEGLALIIGVDRVLEMMRTSINVSGDITASVVMNRIIPAARSYEEEVSQEEEIEEVREKSGEDVVTTDKYTVSDTEESSLKHLLGKVQNIWGGDEEK